MRLTMFAAAVLAAVALSGCGDVPRGRVHGTVQYQGKPLTGATVIFLASDNKTHPVKLKADGTYDVSGVALGPIKVSVQMVISPRSPPKSEIARLRFVPGQAKGNVVDEKASHAPAPPPRMTEKADRGSRLSAQYADADRSGLSFELTGCRSRVVGRSQVSANGVHHAASFAARGGGNSVHIPSRRDLFAAAISSGRPARLPYDLNRKAKRRQQAGAARRRTSPTCTSRRTATPRKATRAHVRTCSARRTGSRRWYSIPAIR